MALYKVKVGYAAVRFRSVAHGQGSASKSLRAEAFGRRALKTRSLGCRGFELRVLESRVYRVQTSCSAFA